MRRCKRRRRRRRRRSDLSVWLAELVEEVTEELDVS